MKALQKVSKFLSDYTSIVVIAIAVITFLVPGMMSWVNYKLFVDFVANKFTNQSIIIGIIMFSMGLTLTAQDFKILAKRPFDICVGAIAHATCLTAIDLKASAILAVTKSGSTAHMMSKHRPGCLIGACTSSERVLRQLNLSWGVYPMLIKEEYSSEILCLRAIEAAQKHKLVKVGDTIVFAGGVPLGIPGRTNLIRVCTVE